MTIKTNASILAVLEESTAGDPVLASASGDFVALQEGFTFAPETELQDNAELRSSIGLAKPIIGIERGNAEFSSYIRHSGVEGQAPDNAAYLKAAFGDEDIESTEYDTVSGSDTETLVVDVGEGAQFRRGQGLLIKDTTRSIRCVKQVSGDNLLLNFKLGSAPAAGVNLGKNVGYLPGSDHPSYTLDLFRGNSGSREVIAGSRISEMNVEVSAGELINGTFTWQGVKYYFDPIKITASNQNFRFNDGTNTITIAIPVGLYRDPHDFAAALESAMNDSISGDSFTVAWNDYGASKGKFTVTSDGGTFELRFNGLSNSVAVTMGFDAIDYTAATTYTSDDEQDWSSAITPSYDSADPRIAKAAEVFIGGVQDNMNVCVRTMTLNLANEISENRCVSAETSIDSVEIRRRTVTIDLVATAEKHEARYFKYYRLGEEVQFQFDYGEKIGGNFQEGKSVCFYAPTATVTAFEANDDEGVVVFNISLQAYVDTDEGEFYLNLL